MITTKDNADEQRNETYDESEQRQLLLVMLGAEEVSRIVDDTELVPVIAKLKAYLDKSAAIPASDELIAMSCEVNFMMFDNVAKYYKVRQSLRLALLAVFDWLIPEYKADQQSAFKRCCDNWVAALAWYQVEEHGQARQAALEVAKAHLESYYGYAGRQVAKLT